MGTERVNKLLDLKVQFHTNIKTCFSLNSIPVFGVGIVYVYRVGEYKISTILIMYI